MRYVIYGAGAIGGVIGARLHLSGHEVALIARGAHLEALRENGLTFISAEGTQTLPIPAAGSPAELDLTAGDVVILAMKSQDTVAALDALFAAAPPAITVVCAQNGVVNERMALRRFPNVYGQLVILPGTHLEPGTVVASASPLYGVLDLGRYPHGSDERAASIAADLTEAGFGALPRDDIMPWKYAKLLRNLANSTQAILGLEERAETLMERARDEARRLLRRRRHQARRRRRVSRALPGAQSHLHRQPGGALGKLLLAEPHARRHHHRGRLPERRDRPPRQAARRAHARERAPAGGCHGGGRIRPGTGRPHPRRARGAPRRLGAPAATPDAGPSLQGDGVIPYPFR